MWGAKRRLQRETKAARMSALPGRVLLQPRLRPRAFRKAQSDAHERWRHGTPNQGESSRPQPFSLREKPARLALELRHAKRKQLHAHSFVELAILNACRFARHRFEPPPRPAPRSQHAYSCAASCRRAKRNVRIRMPLVRGATRDLRGGSKETATRNVRREPYTGNQMHLRFVQQTDRSGDPTGERAQRSRRALDL